MATMYNTYKLPGMKKKRKYGSFARGLDKVIEKYRKSPEYKAKMKAGKAMGKKAGKRAGKAMAKTAYASAGVSVPKKGSKTAKRVRATGKAVGATLREGARARRGKFRTAVKDVEAKYSPAKKRRRADVVSSKVGAMARKMSAKKGVLTEKDIERARRKILLDARRRKYKKKT